MNWRGVAEPFARGERDVLRDRGRSAAREESSTVPFEQIGQSAVKRLWRQKSEDTDWHYARVTTAVLSDLHVGAVNKRSVATEPASLAALAERLAGVEHVVLLGDVLELRESRVADALATAEPLFRTLGEAVGDGRMTIVPGNHDHHLAQPLVEERRLNGRGPLALDSSIPAPGHGPLARIAAWVGGAELRLAYPGLWIRDDVFATHGHYLDLHNTVPTAECVAVSATERALGRGPGDRHRPDDYEAALGPVYSLTHSLGQAGPRMAMSGGVSHAIWRRTGGSSSPGLTGRLIAGLAIPGAVALFNRAGLGPFRPDLTGHALRRSALAAMSAAVDRLGIEAAHVLFGHTHRSGPWPSDDAAEWSLSGGGRLTNTGCWVLDDAFTDPAGGINPYTPGTCVLVGDDGPPRLERLLGAGATRT